MAPARGIVIAFFLSIPLWAGILSLVWWLV